MGVEINQNFQFNDFPFDKPKSYFVGTDGEVRNTYGGEVNSSELCYIINNSNCIIRQPRFTEQEVEDAETVLRVFGRSDTVKRTSEGAISFGGIILSAQLFPSVQPGQSYTLDEIIGGAK